MALQDLRKDSCRGPVEATSKLREDRGQHWTGEARALLNHFNSDQVQRSANILCSRMATLPSLL